MMEASFNENVIIINNDEYNLDHIIKEVFILNDKVIVLFDPDSYIPKFGQFRNLIALDKFGKTIWIAELPTTSSGDCYYKIVSKHPLKANSFQSYQCEIDIDTGQIKNKIFYK